MIFAVPQTQCDRRAERENFVGNNIINSQRDNG